MSEQRDAAPRAPEGVDTEKPSAARIYDWYLGGTQNWAVDREFGRRMEQQWPLVRPGSKQNREFMNRAVRDLWAVTDEQADRKADRTERDEP